jgi:hypothetical protein
VADSDLEGVRPDLKVGPTSSFHAYRDKLAHLGAQGRQLKASVAHARDGDPALARLRLWQRDCAATISELSGGRKVHWLSRAFSEALLVPLNGAESASIVTIIDRILNVLDRAAVSLAQAGTGHATVPATDPPRARFTFIEDVALRVHLEEAYLDGRAALSRDESALALVTFGSILETVITGALERFGVQRLAGYDPPPAPLTEWPFATRIAIAERARLISAACARLPEAARQYRTLLNACGEIAADAAVSTREAKLTRDVLHIILRDLAPGR